MQAVSPAADSPSMNVLEAVADRLGTDATDLEPPLYAVVDPEALDHVVGSESDVRVSFEYMGQTVVVSADGSVDLEDAAGGE